MKHSYTVINGISFPTTEANGMVFLEYPVINGNPPSEKEKILFNKLGEFTKKLIKERNITFDL